MSSLRRGPPLLSPAFQQASAHTEPTLPPSRPPRQFEGERNVAYQGGQQVLQFYGLAGANKWLWLLFESLFFWVFSTACWAALAFMRHQRR